MNLKLERPLLFFDIESTGLNIASDCIVELSFVKIFPDGEERIKTWKLFPWDYEGRCQKPMNPSASAVNGIKDTDLVGCPKFYEVADEIVQWLSDSDLAGFNSTKFDLPMLAEEIERVRKYLNKSFDINLHEKKMVDVQTIYHAMEPRNLKAAYRFYCGGKDFENAHTAEADTVATYEVLKGQLDKYPELKNNVDYLANFAGRPKTVDYSGRLVFGENGEPVISFGKHKGKTAKTVYFTEPSYFAWIQNGEFTLDTKHQFEILREHFEAEKKEAVKQSRKPLEGKAFDDAAQQLFLHFGGEKH